MNQAETLEDLRAGKALTQAEIGDQTTISRIERGLYQASPKTVKSIALALDMPVERVAAACRETFRRARAAREATPIMGSPVLGTGQAMSDDHAPHGTDGGAA